MSTNKLTIKLTEDQQRQIRNATGKSVNELDIDLASMGELTRKQLENVAGGIELESYSVASTGSLTDEELGKVAAGAAGKPSVGDC